MKLEIIILKDDETVLHRSVSTVYEDSNPYNVAIQALIEQLTGAKATNKTQEGAIPLTKTTDKFTNAVPNYAPNHTDSYVPPERPIYNALAAPKQQAFHPDLVNAGVAPKAAKIDEGSIPVIKLDMKTIFKDKK